jgi:hypothetical protein
MPRSWREYLLSVGVIPDRVRDPKTELGPDPPPPFPGFPDLEAWGPPESLGSAPLTEAVERHVQGRAAPGKEERYVSSMAEFEERYGPDPMPGLLGLEAPPRRAPGPLRRALAWVRRRWRESPYA